MKRREFLIGSAMGSGLVSPQNSLEVEVMEVFSSSTGPSALLVHHANEATRETFANWLRSNSGQNVVCTFNKDMKIDAQIFRVSLCFGRGLIVTRTPVVVRPKEVLTIFHM